MKLRIIFFALLFLPISTLHAANLSDLYGSTPSDTPTATGTTYYVDDTGSNTADGSVSAPWATLSYACSQVSPGDTIRVKEGVYTDSSQCVLPVDVDIESDGNNLVKINVGISPYVLAQSPVPVVSGNNEISGIWFDGGDTETVAIRTAGRSNQYIHDCVFSNFTGSGISGGIQVYGKFGRDDVSGQFWEASCTGEETATGTWCYNDPSNSVPLLDTDWGSNIRIEDNEFRDAKAHIGTLKNSKIGNNVFVNNGTYGTPRSCLGGTGVWFSGVEISDNEFYIGDQSSSVAAIELWELSGGCVIRDNWSDSRFSLRYSASAAGSELSCKIIGNSFIADYVPTAAKEALDLQDNISGLLVQNNTFTGSAWLSGLSIRNSNAGGNQTGPNYLKDIRVIDNLFSGLTSPGLLGSIVLETTAPIADMDAVWITGNLLVANDLGVALNEAAGTIDSVTVESNEFRNHTDSAISIDGSGIGIVKINHNQNIDNAVWVQDNVGGKYVENSTEENSPTGTYYVDFTDGDDSNPGTSVSPWQHCPGMEGWSGTATLSAGNAVYFDSADTWTGAGTGNYYLSLKGGVAYYGDAWGAGTKATVTLQAGAVIADTTSIVVFEEDDPVYKTVFDGFVVDANNTRNTGITMNWPSARDLTGAEKVINNCEVRNVEQVGELPTMYGIKIASTEGYVTQNVEVTNNWVHDINSSAIVVYAQINCPTCSIDNVLTDGNTVGPNVFGAASYNGAGIMSKNQVHNHTISNNYVYSANRNNIQIYDDGGSGSGTNTNIIITGNEITGGLANGITFQVPAGCTAEVYNNTIYDNAKSGINLSALAGPGTQVNIHHNTMYSNDWGGILGEDPDCTLQVDYNIFYGHGNSMACFNTGGATITSHSYNLFYDDTPGSTLINNGGVTYASSTLSSWESSALYGDPLFVNPPTDFTLQASSPAITLGAGAE